MVGGVWARGGVLAAMTAGLLASASMTTANAADLGGDCCADLEERIAELEATTARKGNRKVSLEIYGQINQEVLFWDDGFEDNAYLVTNDNARTRIGFKGKAKIDSDWEAGYRLEIGVRTANSKRFTQFNPIGNDNPSDVGLDTRDAYWYVKSKKYGTVLSSALRLRPPTPSPKPTSRRPRTSRSTRTSKILAWVLILRSTTGGLVQHQWRRHIAACSSTRVTSPVTVIAARTRSSTTRRPSPASRPRPRGAVTTTGISLCAMPVSMRGFQIAAAHRLLADHRWPGDEARVPSTRRRTVPRR